MVTGTLSLAEMSEMQAGGFWNWQILGGAETGLTKFLLIPFMIVAFVIFYISSLAEVNRTPFDMPEAECLILYRPTRSLNYHLQIIGRVIRP